MKVIITPSSITGEITAPPSKSCMQRACAAALLATGTTQIINPGKSNDDIAALSIIQALGANVIYNRDGSLTIQSNGVQPIADEINCGESGLSLRMFASIAALSNRVVTFTGKGSLMQRPMDWFHKIFPQLGVRLLSNYGKAPLHIKGPILPKNIEVDGSLSSQFLSGLLIAYSMIVKEPISVTVTHLNSKPYIDLTLQVMKEFGMNVPENQRYKTFNFLSAKSQSESKKTTTHHSPLTTHNYTIEGDWSGAAFLLVAGAIAGEVTVKGLKLNSLQPDKKILEVLQTSGAQVSVSENEVHVKCAELNAFRVDATDCPDLIPPLAALASCCNGLSVINGTHRLEHKESNRAITLLEEFEKMGVRTFLQKNQMIIEGRTPLQSATIHSHNDHRVAMAGAVAALKANAEVIIKKAEAVDKSFPGFYDELKKLGANLSIHG